MNLLLLHDVNFVGELHFGSDVAGPHVGCLWIRSASSQLGELDVSHRQRLHGNCTRHRPSLSIHGLGQDR